MKTINKRRLFYCFIISVIINGIFFCQQLFDHGHFKKQGIIKELYIKSLNKNEVSFFQKAKYSSVAATYFVTSKGDTIRDITKNIWAQRVVVLKEIPFYLQLDSVIYDSKNPKNFQLISEFRNYSITYSAVAYFIVGPAIFTVCLYLITFILEKGIARFRK